MHQQKRRRCCLGHDFAALVVVLRLFMHNTQKFKNMLGSQLESHLQLVPKTPLAMVIFLITFIFVVFPAPHPISTPSSLAKPTKPPYIFPPAPSLFTVTEQWKPKPSSMPTLEYETTARPSSSSLKITTLIPTQNNVVHDPLRWFDLDPVGIAPNDTWTIWSKEISLQVNHSRSDFMRSNPQLVFIKGLKVGGTTVAIALDNISRHYNIPPLRVKERQNRIVDTSNMPCNAGGSLYFHHGYRNPWMIECIPNARFVTVIREPISQLLSWETFKLTRTYYHAYPSKPCTISEQEADKIISQARHMTVPQLQTVLKDTRHCIHDPLRKEVILHLVARTINTRKDTLGTAISISYSWILGERIPKPNVPIETSSKHILDVLRTQYFLVGVTPMLDDFLLLLALHMGWDPTVLYYLHCKPSNLDTRAPEFKTRYAALYSAIETTVAPMTQVYNHVEADFKAKLNTLKQVFPQYDSLLKQFKAGIKQYQLERRRSMTYRWQSHAYKDGHSEYC